MIFIADGGSTKADWVMITKDGSQSNYSTIGFNPYFYNEAAILEELNKHFIHDVPVAAAKKVFFYGSGCGDPIRKSIVRSAFQKIFPHAKIQVDHDLMASAKATCGDQPGIACILGTGSNSCLYDGEKEIDTIANLGYLLGDEGSGTHLGKKLLRAYFYRELPEELSNAFAKEYDLEKRTVMSKLYDGNRGNVYLASFSKFLFDFQDHAYTQIIVAKSLSEFIDRHVLKYEGAQHLPIHFVGSIAYYFSPILKALLAERNLNLGQIIKKPIDNLVDYHISKEAKDNTKK